MRRAGRRMTVALVLVVVLTMFFTVGGGTLLAAGELAGLPLAVGGAVLQIAAIVLVVATLRIRRTLDDRSVARSSLASAHRTTGWVRRVVLGTLVALLGYGVVRLVLGDPWSLATACIVGIGLFFLARGSKAMRAAQEQSLNPQAT
jgi:ABC-type Co2+ transport system permease subunit